MHREAREVFEEMKKSGCSPNVVTYTSLVYAYSNAGGSHLDLHPHLIFT
jgi:hypothetical protein